MSKQSQTIQVGPGGATCLTILFVLLKIFGYINWSWWWVLCPMWAGLAIAVVVLAAVAIGGLIYAAVMLFLERKK